MNTVWLTPQTFSSGCNCPAMRVVRVAASHACSILQFCIRWGMRQLRSQDQDTYSPGERLRSEPHGKHHLARCHGSFSQSRIVCLSCESPDLSRVGGSEMLHVSANRNTGKAENVRSVLRNSASIGLVSTIGCGILSNHQTPPLALHERSSTKIFEHVFIINSTGGISPCVGCSGCCFPVFIALEVSQ